MNVSLTPKQEQYIAEQVALGDFQNASELVRDALRLHQYNRTRMLNELRAEIERAWDSPPCTKTISHIVSEAVVELKK